MQGAFFIAGVILALTDRLTTWWGIVIMVVTFLISIGIATARENPEHRSNTVEVFTLIIPTGIAFYVGNAIWHPWGAIIGALAMNPIGTLLADFLMVRLYRWPTVPDVYEYGDGIAAGREAKRHAKSARRQGARATYERLDWSGWVTEVDG